MIKYFLLALLSIGLFLSSPSYADGMIISFEEEINDDSLSQFLVQAPPAQDKVETPTKQQPESNESDSYIQSYPPTLEKKDFLKDHEDAPTPPSDFYEKTFMQTLLVIIGILLLIFLGVWLIRKFSGGRFRQFNVGKTIKILERRPLSHKSMLYIVDIRGKQFLIAESQLEVSKISSLEWMGEEEKEV